MTDKAQTYSQWLKGEKSRVIKQFGLREGLIRWNKMMEKGIVKNKWNKGNSAKLRIS
tara:strand:+ start:43 stop:213 length:171 start_codon:yes stop_codon:yes gene_type:complete